MFLEMSEKQDVICGVGVVYNEKLGTRNYKLKTFHYLCTRKNKLAPVAKLVDAPDLGSGNSGCVGSSPIRRTVKQKPAESQRVLSAFMAAVIMSASSKLSLTYSLKNIDD